MQRILSLIVLMFVTVVSQSIWAMQASSITGVQLRNACSVGVRVMTNKFVPRDPREAMQGATDNSMCVNYITAVNDTLLYMENITAAVDCNHTYKKPYCIPDNVTIQMLIDTILKYVAQFPTTINGQAVDVIVGAYSKFYPCP